MRPSIATGRPQARQIRKIFGKRHQTLELLLALHRSAIESNDHVVFFEARLAGRRVLINLNNLHAAIVLQLERLNAFGAYIGDTYTQI